MRPGLFLYQFATRVLSPFAGMILRRRASRGKENRNRLNERWAKTLPARPDGPLIWFHAASVGESLIQLELARTILSQGYSASLLFTCQTLTGADCINAGRETIPAFANVWTLQQMAPLDTAASARRFMAHWQPDMAIFAEGEIWPNLLAQLHQRKVATALINARMTNKSISGWRRWPNTAKTVFDRFNIILASDKKTATGLSELVQRPITCVGNLKSALPAPQVSTSELSQIKARLPRRKVLVAASTHDGEEALILDALLQMQPRPFAIIAPRHPERGDQVERMISCSNLTYARRSREDEVTPDTDILLADTMGEMGLWYRLADTVYLGGGHAPGVGGHNPLEPLRLGKPVLTGPSLFNFEDMTKALVKQRGLTIVDTVADIVAAFPAPAPDKALLEGLEAEALGPMTATLGALEPYLKTLGQER